MNPCPDCDGVASVPVSRRQFVQTASAAAVAAVAAPALLRAADSGARKSEPLVKKLYESLTPAQKEEVCFPWDYTDDRGLLRMHVSNNWQITDKKFSSGFFTKDQQDILEAVFWDLYSPDWHDRIRKQLQDDAGGYGKEQSIALFGEPGSGKFELVMTGRHLTIRCDGDCVEHTAFGGPIFYGHAASGFDEKVGHPGNVYWHQALLANDLYKMLDGKQRSVALIAEAPVESQVHFRGKSPELPGLPISELTADQKTHAQKVLASLIEPYRQVDRDEVQRCLTAQGGYDQCRISFYQSGDLGDDRVWDIWRIEGPSFVWHYRGTPHVHVFVNVADDPSVKITAKG
ncbi:MAG TPA: DUF3500 domain-containing protein [Planctomycetaceae bacterium]|nr:DUF3500 domain-containing protein [Planctomycetaceae bacterium]